MKRTIFLLTALISFTIANAQFTIGPRAGLGVNWTDLEETSGDIKSGDAEFGLNIGAFVRLGGKKLYLQPEVLFTSTSSNIIINEGQVDEQIVESKLNKIDVPVIIGIKPISILSLQFGPVGSILVNEDDNLGDKVAGAVRNYKDFTYGFQAGAGLELGSLLIDLRYEGNLSDVGNGSGTFTFDERTPQIKGLIGFKLF